MNSQKPFILKQKKATLFRIAFKLIDIKIQLIVQLQF